MTVIGLLHPGEMGAAIGAGLVQRGRTVLWASEGRSAATAERAAAAGLTDAGDVDGLLARAEVILSVCPPHAAASVAAACHGFDGLYLDANAISPDSVRRIAAGQPRLVDGGIVGPPPTEAGTTRLYLSGPTAAEAVALFDETALDARVVSAEIGAASALKMAYAAWTKGTQAMLLGVRALARAEGIEAALLAEWELSQPGLDDRSQRAARAASTKGWRWEAEMEEIAASFEAAGLPDGFHRAAAEIFARSPRDPAGGDDPLEQIIAALLDGRSGGSTADR